MDRALVATYDKPVPRYTSYPTAAQFTTAVGPSEHVSWLKDLDRTEAALYLHVPFCQQLCWYCACHTVAMRSPGTLDRYASALLAELERTAAAAEGVVLGSVQWGGGTPSQLGTDRLLIVGQRIKALFDRRCGSETSLEIDPRYCDDELVDTLAAIGVTRASLGVQDFDLSVQTAINRLQSFEATRSALDRLRAAGIRRSNIDLVYGLPLQTLDTLSRTLDQAVALAPDRFAVFAYAHVPWMKAHQRLIDTASLPAAELRAVMAELVREKLLSAGYLQVGLDHFARPGDPLSRALADGKLRRTFQGYVVDESSWVIGVGASSISSLPRGHSQNQADTAAYMQAIEAGGFAIARGVAIDADDRLRGDIISQLMCGYTAEVGDACRRHGVAPDVFFGEINALDGLQRDGLVVVDRDRLVVTDRGRPLVRSVCAAFDRYYTGAEGRHARGI